MRSTSDKLSWALATFVLCEVWGASVAYADADRLARGRVTMSRNLLQSSSKMYVDLVIFVKHHLHYLDKVCNLTCNVR